MPVVLTESQLLLNASRFIIDYLKEEFIKQGHSLSQAWEDSVIAQDDGDEGVGIYATGYGMIVDAGIAPERIPFGGEGTGGGTNAYILGLVRFWKLRKPGITDKQALRLAFATANVQKVEGMSTEASKSFSSTGQRQHFMDALNVLFTDYIDNFVFVGLDLMIEQQADEPQTMIL